MNLEYGRLSTATQRAVDDINALIRQMSRDPWEMDLKYLERVLEAPGVLFVAWDEGRIVGCTQLSVEVLVTKVKGWIEDVVVDESYRGQGVAKRLIEMAVEHARSAGCKHVNLTSGADRESAYKVYEGVGFHRRESVLFRLDLE